MTSAAVGGESFIGAERYLSGQIAALGPASGEAKQLVTEVCTQPTGLITSQMFVWKCLDLRGVLTRVQATDGFADPRTRGAVTSAS
jgi:hypothetical protein